MNEHIEKGLRDIVQTANKGSYKENQEALRDSEVEEFISKIWHHPLVTPETIKLREGLEERVTNHFDTAEISSSEYVAIPHGSIIGFADETSDIDLLAFFTESARAKYLAASQGYKDAPKLPDDDIQVGKQTTVNYFINQINQWDISANTTIILALLITPDDITVGNPDMLAQTRLDLIEILREKKKVNLKYSTPVEDRIRVTFKRHYSGWPEYPQGPDERRRNLREKREKRYERILSDYSEKRSQRSSEQKKEGHKARVENTIENSRQNLELIDLDTLFDYLESHNGKLEISSTKTP